LIDYNSCVIQGGLVGGLASLIFGILIQFRVLDLNRTKFFVGLVATIFFGFLLIYSACLFNGLKDNYQLIGFSGFLLASIQLLRESGFLQREISSFPDKIFFKTD